MDGVRTFLESSSIHGLTHISTSRKFAKVFWITIVFAGFTFAGYMINNSIKSWAERPIKTTLETRPISEINLPKVTVCPPKNTFTDLNYDLMLAEKITLSNEMREDFFNYAKSLIDEHILMHDIDRLQEEDRYYNWYHGYTKLGPTFQSYQGLNYFVSTSATSGVVRTQYFGEEYNPNLVAQDIHYQVSVYPPESVRNNTNVTLHFKLKKLSLTDLPKLQGFDNYNVEGKSLDEGLTSTEFNFTPPAGAGISSHMRLWRAYIHPEEIMNKDMKLMPGFELSWYYTGLEEDLEPYKRYYNYLDEINKEFRK